MSGGGGGKSDDWEESEWGELWRKGGGGAREPLIRGEGGADVRDTLSRGVCEGVSVFDWWEGKHSLVPSCERPYPLSPLSLPTQSPVLANVHTRVNRLASR